MFIFRLLCEILAATFTLLIIAAILVTAVVIAGMIAYRRRERREADAILCAWTGKKCRHANDPEKSCADCTEYRRDHGKQTIA